MKKRIAVVLFNLGGPDKLESVRPFLFNLFNDRAIISIPQPFRWLIARMISNRRTPVAREIYQKLGGGSPLLSNTLKQASALEVMLSKSFLNYDIKCFISMRYWHPMTTEAVKAVKEWGADEVILLPLYPQFSTTTSGSSFREWERVAERVRLDAKSGKICCYPKEDGFITSMVERLKRELESVGGGSRVRVLFSAHGLPQRVIDRGDPYQWAVEQTSEEIVRKLGWPGLDWRIGYQSRVGPLEWIKPYIEDEILAAGIERIGLIVVPVAFVSEHSETLVELDIEYQKVALDNGVAFYKRVGTVSEDEAFIAGLAGMVEEALVSRDVLDNIVSTRFCPKDCFSCPTAMQSSNV